MGAQDATILRDGERINPGYPEWDRNGEEHQSRNKLLKLKDYLSYDEIMLGSLMGVSGHSYFINEGSRHNIGKPAKVGTFEPRGVIIG